MFLWLTLVRSNSIHGEFLSTLVDIWPTRQQSRERFIRAHAGQNIRKLVKDGFVIRKPTVIHSRSRARRSAEAKAKGRHTGYGAFTWNSMMA